MYMYVYIYVYLHLNTHICIYIYIHKCIYMKVGPVSGKKGEGSGEKKHHKIEKYNAWEWKKVGNSDFFKQIIDCLDDTGIYIHIYIYIYIQSNIYKYICIYSDFFVFWVIFLRY
jgi:hypothetical protein